MSSLKFVVSSLDAIAASKEAQRNKQLAESVKTALEAIKASDPQFPDAELIFAPLQLASKSPNIQVTTTALDCIGKLISYSFLSVPPSISTPSIIVADADAQPVNIDPENPDKPAEQPTPETALPSPLPTHSNVSLIERAIDTICDCFQGDQTPPEIQLQILKSLLSAVLNDKIVVHGAGLLKAVRQVYNVFLLSRNTANQQVAQGTLTQMVGTVFERVKTRLNMKEARLSLSNLRQTASHGTLDDSADSANSQQIQDGEEEEEDNEATKLTLKDLEHHKSFDDSHVGDGSTMVSRLKPEPRRGRSVSEVALSDVAEDNEALDAEDEVYIRDAYLVFRSFCKLSTKVLAPDQLFDFRGQAMRSKLVSLHLLHTLLNNNLSVFISPLCTIRNSVGTESTSFLQAIKYYLCLSITRNGASSVDKVFDVCAEIFWLMIKFMREPFKKEIEVFLHEIYLAVLNRRTAPASQKLTVVNVLCRFCADPRALVEFYLNYDCGRDVENFFQGIIEDLSRFAISQIVITPAQEQLYEEKNGKITPPSEWQLRTILPPQLSAAHMAPKEDVETDVPKEYAIKRVCLEALVESLRSLVNWSEPLRQDLEPTSEGADARPSIEIDTRPSIDPSIHERNFNNRLETPITPSTPILDDDPDQLEKEKARKTAMTNAIKLFNFKPKKGIKTLISESFIPSDSPLDIAKFLLSDDRLDKAMIGEFLGEGDQANIDIMHAFVDSMDFNKKRFVDALRLFLQSFRLPGEAQKIDRFMLKFAERYVTGNPNAFANADTAYVLAYSVIMLNTDQHSSKIAKRMSKEEFIRNNRGINDNADLPDEYLIAIFDEIANNEIVLNSEREAAAAAGIVNSQPSGLAAGLVQGFSNVGRDLAREAHLQQSEEISHRSEQLFRNLFKNERRNAKTGNKFIPAISSKHVGPMFEVTWMSLFSAFSSQLQKAQNIEVNKLCLEGMKMATKIACVFDLSTPREAFMSAIKNATNLNNPHEIMAKNVKALKVILELGQTEGNFLKGSWKDILMCISQLDRLQLITEGVDENAVPDVSKARFLASPRDGSDPRPSISSTRRPTISSRTGPVSQGLSMEIAAESRSDEVVKGVDRIFTNTAKLSGDAIVHFARALTEVSWDEIKVSGSNDFPRTYSLQKIVEISYYNMTRVRIEWTHIWDVLGEHFNVVGCHANTAIVFSALDSLRQLSMRFMEIEELAGFKFQKDFLKPFEHVLSNTQNVAVKELVLRCLIQMIQARGDNIKSGWRTMFGVFTVAAREPHESIVSLAFENVTLVYRSKFSVVISQGAFTDLVVCLTEFSKNMRFQKRSLQALEALKSIIPRLQKTPECPLSRSKKNGQGSPGPGTSAEEGFWFPILFAFHDVLMTGEDLEVRSNALEYFFQALSKYGDNFNPDFWDILWRQQLEPIFMVLRSRPEMTNALNHEEMSVWLSTTMIQALRNLIALFTHFFDSLEYMLDRFLKLLALCICQEHDTISRIGGNCLQQLILKNVTKFTLEHWSLIVSAFCELFERTTARELFSANTLNSATTLTPLANGYDFSGPLTSSESPPSAVDEKSLKINGREDSDAANENTEGEVDESELTSLEEARTPILEDYKPSSNLQQPQPVVTAARRRFFNRIISRCVVQLLMIETVNELFSNDAVYAQIPSTELLRLMALLKSSFLFARKFNNDRDLRMRLWREGFMRQPPNLLKQESGSAATYISILFRMYADNSPERAKNRKDIESALMPLCKDIIKGYILLEEESQHRNIEAWRPVVVEVLEGYAMFPREPFAAFIKEFYPLTLDLLCKKNSSDLRAALVHVLRRVGDVGLGISELGKPLVDRRGSTATVWTDIDHENEQDSLDAEEGAMDTMHRGDPAEP
ncbi:Protein transport protein SEC7 [Ceratocystis lukuohia]|uniref:Protein transport protein SEC7 n=1 Tax=Ceratocystis lukuohia TaxID=2019550 RepID=A0ABR4MNR6_9PEZI